MAKQQNKMFKNKISISNHQLSMVSKNSESERKRELKGLVGLVEDGTGIAHSYHTNGTLVCGQLPCHPSPRIHPGKEIIYGSALERSWHNLFKRNFNQSGSFEYLLH